MPKAQPGIYTVTAAMWEARRCQRGHDLTGPDTTTVTSRIRRCKQCRIDDGVYGMRALPDGSLRMVRSVDGKCGRGLHELVGGKCRPCQLEYQKQRRAAGPVIVILKDMPPKQVLLAAACTLADSALFDPITREEQEDPALYPLISVRMAAAGAICQDCPVRAECLADALDRRRLGFYGGQYLSPKTYSPRQVTQKAM